MALVESQEVSLRISAETLGQSDVSALADRVEALAREGGEAAPRFAELSAEIRRLGEQQIRINGLQSAIESAKGAFSAVREARHEVEVLDKALADAKGAAANREAIRLLEKELAAANRQLSAAERAWTAQKSTLAAARTEAAGMGVDTKNLGTAQQQLVTALDSAQAALAEQTESVRKAREAEQARLQEAREHAAEEDRLAAIVTASKAKMAQAAQDQLAAEKRTYAEAAAAAKRYDEQTRAIAAGAQKAFDSIGIRSSAKIQAEITAIQQGLQRLASDAKVSGAEFDRAWAQGQKRIAALEAEMNGAVAGMNRVGAAGDQLGTKLKGIAAAVGGIFAVTQLPGLAADLSRTADLYANLGGRIDLINSSQAGFNVTLSQTSEIARDTHSGLAGTTNLLASLARAGGELGLSQKEVVGLTETINKANQVAGQSAAAADAAIVQLVQGLQSGVLRGEEFNSIMEQSPRLAKALADGLGVPIGALRGMAEQGKLTSEVVIRALQSQSKAIDTEFGKLPLTVGRAISDLSTSWTMFLGELDKGAGVSATAAKAIEGVANNLDALAKAATFAGEAALAALAVKAAGAARAYTAELVVATGATTRLGAATTALAGAVSALGPVLRTMGWIQVAVEVGSVVSALIDLREEYAKHAELAVSVSEKQDLISQRLAAISAQTGVTVTSTQELNAAVAAGQIHFDGATARWVAGAAALAEVRTRGQELAAQFQEMATKGKSAEEAFTALLAKFAPDSFIGVQALGEAMIKLQADGTISAQQVEQAWQQALAPLSAEGLVQFGETARMVFQGTAAEAGMLATALDAQLRAALTGLGLDASEALTGMSAKFIESAKNVGVITKQFDTLNERGVNATALVQQGVEKMLAAAATPTELDALKALVAQLGREGKLAGDQVAAALAQINAKADEAVPGINSVTEAFKELGVVSDKSLQGVAERARAAFVRIRDSGTASARELQQAFQAYAERVVAANNGVVSSTLQAEASQNGLRVTADATGKVIVQSMTEAAFATGRIGAEAQKSAAELEAMGEAAEAAAQKAAAAAAEQEAANRSVTGHSSFDDWSPGELEKARRGDFGEAVRQGYLDWVKQKREELKRNAPEPRAPGGGSFTRPEPGAAVPERVVRLDLSLNGGPITPLFAGRSAADAFLSALQTAARRAQ